MAAILRSCSNLFASGGRLTAGRSRRKSQAEEILAMLRAAGDRGVTNAELWVVAHAAHSRIADLRARGHAITCTREAQGLYRYVLDHAVDDNERRPAAPPIARTLPLFDGVAV